MAVPKETSPGVYEWSRDWPIVYQSDRHHAEAVCYFDAVDCYNDQMLKRYHYWHEQVGIVGADPAHFKPLSLIEWQGLRAKYGCPVVPAEVPQACDYLRPKDYHAAMVRWAEYRRDRLCEDANPETYTVPSDRDWEDRRAGCPTPPAFSRLALFPWELDDEILCASSTAQEYNAEVDRRFDFWSKNYPGTHATEPRRYIQDAAELAALKIDRGCPTRFSTSESKQPVSITGEVIKTTLGPLDLEPDTGNGTVPSFADSKITKKEDGGPSLVLPIVLAVGLGVTIALALFLRRK